MTAAIGRALLWPVWALALAVGSVVYVLLLPICGIATVAEGVVRSAWRRLAAGTHTTQGVHDHID